MKKVIILLLLATILITGCFLFPLEPYGTWLWTSGSEWEQITLSENDTYTITGWEPIDGNYAFAGTFTFDDNTITLDGIISIPYEVTKTTLTFIMGPDRYVYTKL